MDHFTKYDTNPFEDLSWNFPEQKQGSITVIGGNSQNFRTEIKTTESLSNSFPIRTVSLVLPDALKANIPAVDNILFVPSTDSGSFAESEELENAFNVSDINIVTGNLSKNSITAKAVLSACTESEKPTFVARDTIDVLTTNNLERLLMNENICFFITMPGVQKLFRSVYYPKMITMSQSLMQIAEALHKFTLSYPVSIITIHNNQILIVKDGEVSAIPLENTSYTPLTFWMGDLLAKIAAYNLFNPNNFKKATISAIF